LTAEELPYAKGEFNLSKKSTVNKRKRKAIKKVSGILILLAIVLVAVIAIYNIARLVINPSDIVMVERGVVALEEQVTRIYNKGRSYSK